MKQYICYWVSVDYEGLVKGYGEDFVFTTRKQRRNFMRKWCCGVLGYWASYNRVVQASPTERALKKLIYYAIILL